MRPAGDFFFIQLSNTRQRVYDIGRKDAENHIDALCRWMEASAGED